MALNNVLFVNNFSTTLAGAISASSTTANLASGAGASLPTISTGDYICLTFVDAATGLTNEVVHVTAVSGDAITIVRGQEGTTAAAWAENDIATCLPTAGGMEKVQATGGIPCVDTGAANAMVVTTDVPVSALFFGLTLNVTPVASNTSSTTINVNGLGAVSVLTASGNATTGGEITAGVPVRVFCAGTAGPFYLTTNKLTGTALYTPSASVTIAPTADFSTVIPSAAATITITAGSKVGQRVRIYGHATYAITVASSLSTGAQALVFPDNEVLYSFVIPAQNLSRYVDLVFDGANWRANSEGIYSVVGVAHPSVTLSDLVNGGVAPSTSPTIKTALTLASTDGTSTSIIYTDNASGSRGANDMVFVTGPTDGRKFTVIAPDGTMSHPASPTAPAPSASDNSTKLATTSWLYTCMSYVAAAAGFSISLGIPGYVKFPSWLGGLIIQWGSLICPNAQTVYSASFPITFPNSVLKIVASSLSLNSYGGCAEVYSTTAYAGVFSSSAGGATSYIAIGY